MTRTPQKFTCNICGVENAEPKSQVHRELLHCEGCGSSARYRGVALAYQKHIVGNVDIPLRLLKERIPKSGIGMSDWPDFVRDLQSITAHTDTFYHQEPRLDLTDSASCNNYSDLDYVICSEVLEHVRSPVSACLQNIRRMLKDEGVLILTVPYLEGYESIEHFPHLENFKIVELSGKYILINVGPDGSTQSFENLSFHGGPGAVLEMRVFGEGDILSMLAFAGFSNVEVMEPNLTSIGYVWDYLTESPLWRGRKGKSCVMVCRP